MSHDTNINNVQSNVINTVSDRRVNYVRIDDKDTHEINYADKADIVVEDPFHNIIDDLLHADDEVIEEKQFELLTRTDQNSMFDELEKRLITEYDKVTTKNNIYKDIERPIKGSSLISTKDVRSSDLNPNLNPNMYHIDENNNATIWETYDKLTSNNHVNNYDELEPNDISKQYLLGNNDHYGSQFDTYSM
jgi:hypothetical protein